MTFNPRLHWGALPDGSVAFADSTTYAIKIAAAGTGISRVLTRPFAPEPMTGRRIGDEKNRRLRELEAIPDEELSRTGSVINGEPVRRDPGEERQRRRGEEPSSDDGPVDLLTPAGTYLGTFPGDDADIPDAFGPGGLAAFVETDELEVRTVVVGRLSVG